MFKHPADRYAFIKCGPIASLLGGKAPKTSTQSVVDTKEEQKKAKTARSALLSTEGGILGSELAPGQVSRSTLLGN